MAYVEVWDETKPAGTRALNLGDDDIREFKRAIRERLAAGGMYFLTTDDANNGLYNYVKFYEQAANPTAEADRGFLFTKDVAGITELFWMDSAGNNFQITSGGAFSLVGIGGWTARGDIIRGGASAWEVYSLGTANQSLVSDGTDVVWGDCAKKTLTTQGDILYQDAAGLQRLGAGTAGQLLQTGGAGANPSWTTPETIRGWINFNGTGTIAVRDSFNVSGIVDNGTGEYTVTWDTDFATVNYAIAANACRTDGNGDLECVVPKTIAAGSVDISMRNDGNGANDCEFVLVMAIGDQ